MLCKQDLIGRHVRVETSLTEVCPLELAETPPWWPVLGAGFRPGRSWVLVFLHRTLLGGRVFADTVPQYTVEHLEMCSQSRSHVECSFHNKKKKEKRKWKKMKPKLTVMKTKLKARIMGNWWLLLQGWVRPKPRNSKIKYARPIR